MHLKFIKKRFHITLRTGMWRGQKTFKRRTVVHVLGEGRLPGENVVGHCIKILRVYV